MSRTELIVIVAAALFAVFLLGWFANWVIYRLTRVSRADLDDADAMTRRVQDAQDTRDQAIEHLHAREAEMDARNRETEARLGLVLEELREARTECEELRAYIDHRLAR